MLPATELTAVMTGASVLIGTFLQTPIKIFFDNLGTAQVVLSVSYDGGATKTQFKTFSPGEAMTMDDDHWTFPKGMSFYGVGASGTFSIAYTYAKQAG